MVTVISSISPLAFCIQERFCPLVKPVITSLKQRLALLLLLPVALLLVSAGVTGFVYARNLLVEQWRETAILKLERAAHKIDMRLDRPAGWIEIFHEALANNDDAERLDFIIERLAGIEGVADVAFSRLDLDDERRPADRFSSHHGMHEHRMMRRNGHRRFEITPPRYDTETGNETVSLVSHIRDRADQTVAKLEVIMQFDFLLQDIEEFGWWQSQLACIVDSSGRYLAHSEAMDPDRSQLGESGEPVELAVLEQMQNNAYGTHLGAGHPPKLVSGFYRLRQAPWVLVMYAPGREILAPVVEFRFYFAVAGIATIVFILLLIQFVGGRMVQRIKNIAAASEKVARQEYSSPLPATSKDEIGQLESSFNAMVDGLKERDLIRDTFGRYMDKDIAAKLLERPETARLGGEKRKVAILMTDIRGFTAISDALNPEQIIGLLNRYFSLMIDITQKYRGIIVDFYGDGILVFFDPYDGPVEPAIDQAIRCSTEMRDSMHVLLKELKKEGLPEIETGTGIHSGEVVVGNIGSKTRAKYGIVGSAVNITSRICEKAGGGEIVLTEPTCRRMNNLAVRKSFTTNLKGIQGEVTLCII